MIFTKDITDGNRCACNNQIRGVQRLEDKRMKGCKPVLTVFRDFEARYSQHLFFILFIKQVAEMSDVRWELSL